MRRSYCYKVRMSPSVIRRAEGQLVLCCELYNSALEHRRDWWKRKQSVSYFAQSAEMPGLKELRPEFRAINSNVLLNVLKRVDWAFASFYRRCKTGGTPGYPRFKSGRRYDSLTFRRSGWKLEGRRLTLQGIGTARLFLSRPVEGTVKTVTIRRDACGDWFVSFSCDNVAPNILPETGKPVGIDMGLASFIATSDGEVVGNPRPLIAADVELRRTQRAISKQRKGGSNRRKRAKILARQHRRVQRVRRDFHHKTALGLVRRYDIIAVEDLNVAGMVRCRSFARSISDAGWSSFISTLRCKAESAGRLVIAVNPRGTSQVCSECGVEVRKTLADRIHDCPHCGYVADRDVNASRNILALGLGEAHRLASSPATKVAA